MSLRKVWYNRKWLQHKINEWNKNKTRVGRGFFKYWNKKKVALKLKKRKKRNILLFFLFTSLKPPSPGTRSSRPSCTRQVKKRRSTSLVVWLRLRPTPPILGFFFRGGSCNETSCLSCCPPPRSLDRHCNGDTGRKGNPVWAPSRLACLQFDKPSDGSLSLTLSRPQRWSEMQKLVLTLSLSLSTFSGKIKVTSLPSFCSTTRKTK